LTSCVTIKKIQTASLPQKGIACLAPRVMLPSSALGSRIAGYLQSHAALSRCIPNQFALLA
jgi:hypothetical protein